MSGLCCSYNLSLLAGLTFSVTFLRVLFRLASQKILNLFATYLLPTPDEALPQPSPSSVCKSQRTTSRHNSPLASQWHLFYLWVMFVRASSASVVSINITQNTYHPQQGTWWGPVLQRLCLGTFQERVMKTFVWFLILYILYIHSLFCRH